MRDDEENLRKNQNREGVSRTKMQTIISLFLFVISFFSPSRSVFISISVWDLRLSLFVDARCIGRFPCF